MKGRLSARTSRWCSSERAQYRRDLSDSGDTVTVSYGRGDSDGAFLIFIDTDELPKDRSLRVCVNDGPVFSARPLAGDHDFHFVGEYVDELNRAR